MSSSDIAEVDNRNRFQKAWDGFKSFIWDPQTKTVMGRTGKSWGKILTFYFIYYGLLACIFAIAITACLNSLDEYTPSFQTRVQAPGITIQPKTPSLTQQTSDVVFNRNDANSYQKYIDILDKFLADYDDSKQANNSEFMTCVKGNANTNQEFNGNEIMKACRFSRSSLGKCSSGTYGYDVGQPCVILKVNRIINWYPVGYTDLSKATGNSDSKAPPLTQVLSDNGQVYDPYLMYVACYGSRDEDIKHLNGGTSMSPTVYYPENNGVGFEYFPYFGLKRQPKYLNPLVAVQFTNVSTNVDISVKCKAYAYNIEDSARMGIGFFGFYLRVNDK